MCHAMRSLQTSKWFLLFALLVPGLAAQDDAAEEYEQLLASGQRKLLAGRLLEAEQSFSLTSWPLSRVCVCLLSAVCVRLLLFVPWHRGCWGGWQGERGPE